MKGKKDLWFRIGEGLERALQVLPGERDDPGPLRKARRKKGKGRRRKGSRPGAAKRLTDLLGEGEGKLEELARSPLGGLAAAGTGTMALRLVKRWTDTRRPPMWALLGAAGTGAAAALLRELVLAGLDSEEGDGTDDLVAAMLSGASEGLVYASVLEPFLPDSTVVQGSVLGAAGYAAAPFGGISGVLRPLGVHRSIPVLGGLLEDAEEQREDRSLVEHLAWGMLLAVAYRSLFRDRSSSGTTGEP
jgi:hypothetical protein